jgi:lipid A disaccharide synthetase
MLVSLNCKRAG